MEALALLTAAAFLLRQTVVSRLAERGEAPTPARIEAVIDRGLEAAGRGPLAALGLTQEQSERAGEIAGVGIANLAALPLHTFNAVTLNVGGEIVLLGVTRTGGALAGRTLASWAYTGEDWRPGLLIEKAAQEHSELLEEAWEQAEAVAAAGGVSLPDEILGIDLGILGRDV